MKLHKVLILHKKSTFQIQAMEHQESRFIKLLDEESEVLGRVKVAHAEHLGTLEYVERELSKRRIQYKSIARAELNDQVQDVDLIISVGGDGTFLDASHFTENVPLLGVNSSSSSSFGHFCIANEQTFRTVLDTIESGAITPIEISRLKLVLNQTTLSELVLNEVLVTHTNPAATSRYFIEIDNTKEEQRSSGIWIGTAAGSTGSLRSAGGRVVAITDEQIQYIVREPCLRPNEHWRLLKGMVDRNSEIRIISQMRTGALFVDGQHINYHFGLGDNLYVRRSPHNLKAYVANHVNNIFV